MVYCNGRVVFLDSVDSSEHIKNSDYLKGLLKKYIDKVGKKNVVQIVTDNASAYKKAGKALEKEHHIYWTPCAAHSIDLMFEAIGGQHFVKKAVEMGRTVTNFIYNHSWMLSKMRYYCKRELVRPGATRFATNFIALESFQKSKAGLRTLFTSSEWTTSNICSTQMGQKVEGIILSKSFWVKVQQSMDVMEPMYKVLRIVDSEERPTMGSVYPAIQIMKEAIEKSSPDSYMWVHRIIDERWKRTMDHPLHLAGNFIIHLYISVCIR
jgi:hypothetical protein